ncbi:MAG: hypothetical protein GEU79_16325, partial [Acidimicrobiia bacterium]|nr:hypothetical protein [Acidimicrobiia bacterium]
MGQTIEINKTTTVGDLLVVDTDRSISGQNGRSFSVDDDLGPGPDGKLGPGEFDTQMARRLFE